MADDVRYYGRWMRDEAEKRIGHLYPKVKVTKEMAKDRPDLKVSVTLEIQASLPEGASPELVRTVTENCRTLRFTDHGFEEE